MNNHQFFQESRDLLPYSRTMRRDFHQHPELSFQEIRTADIIARELSKSGLSVRTGVGKTGVVGLLETGKPGPVILLRFDMDALPIQEQNQVEYRSLKDGVMHACGHDGHMAIGLTTARLLSSCRQDLIGSVKFMFQPAEEGHGGAEAMLADGVLQNPKPDYALSMHLWNELPLGQVGVIAGPLMAGSDTFNIKVEGRGGHGALPQTTIDPVFASAQIISSLQSIVSRSISPLKSAVISVTCIQAGSAHNIIPSSVEMKGTIRTFEPEVRNLVLERCARITTDIAEALGCTACFESRFITPPVVNDPGVTNLVIQVIRDTIPDMVIHSNHQTTVSEDMAFVLQQVPGCYLMVGSANHEKKLDFSHHHACFDFDEEVMPIAAAILTSAVIQLQQQ